MSEISDFLSDFMQWNVSGGTVFAVALMSVLAAYLLTRQTAGSRLFTFPIAFIALHFSGLFANFLGRDIHLAKASEMQMAVVLAVGGQCVIALILLAVFKADNHLGSN